MNEHELVRYQLDEDTGVATLTLNRPERYNAFNLPMIAQWVEVLGKVEKDERVRVLVVTGSGKAFCAGGEIEELESFLSMTALERKNFLWHHVHQIPLALERIDCPVIAALNGTARGAGLDMALMCDLRIMGKSVQLAESYIAMGLMPGDGGSYFLPRLVGVAKALELLWTGDVIDAEEALRIGLVNKIVADDELMSSTLAFAERVARQSSAAIRFTKRSVYQSMTMPLRAHLDMISSHMSVLEDMPEFKERVMAFKNRKRSSA